jgi:hypothetical protein
MAMASVNALIVLVAVLVAVAIGIDRSAVLSRRLPRGVVPVVRRKPVTFGLLS